MTEDQQTVISLLCDYEGRIIEIIRDDLSISWQLDRQHGVYALMDQMNTLKFQQFLQEVKSSKAVFNWELNLNIGSRSELYYFNGGLFDGNILIVGSRYNSIYSYFYDELMKINNQQMVSLRDTIKKLSLEMVDKLRMEQQALEEFSALNNELLLLQRQLAKANIDLQLSKEAAEQASLTKSSFLATMSHEIRTPMNGILSMAELLYHSSLTEAQKKSVSIILDSGGLLLTIINDILDLSKIEAGQMRLEEKEFVLGNLIDPIVQLMEPRAEARGNVLTLEMDAGANSRFCGDPDRLRQILLNLVGNAIKFTEQGHIDIQVRVLNSSRTKTRLLFEVRDTGIGISEENAKRLFEPFYQVNPGYNQQVSSTGLGLSITKRLLELMNGRIGVNSRPGAGSTFWFELELEPVSAAASPVSVKTGGAEAPVGTAVEQPVLRGKDLRLPVLLAEDNAINQQVALLQLKKLGITRVEVAEDGLQALEKLQTGRYALVLMDNQMPVMDGLDAARRIRDWESGQGPDVPRAVIIAMTANAMQGDRERCMEAGMDDFITKPVMLGVLKEILLHWLPDLPAEPEPGAAVLQAGAESLLNLSVIRELGGMGEAEDRMFLGALFELYRQDTPLKLGQLRAAADSGDMEGLRRMAHDLKSSSASLGLQSMAALSGEIEQLARSGEEGPGLAARLEALAEGLSEACAAFEEMLNASPVLWLEGSGESQRGG